MNGIIAKDVDKDGNMDLILAGNYYGFEVSITRNDSSIGLFLKGNGEGDFIPLPYYESGLFLNGDVRHIRSIKVGLDRRPVIIAAKNDDFVQIVEMIDAKTRE